MTDRLQGGMKHAPSVLCIVTGIPRHLPEAGANGVCVIITAAQAFGSRYTCCCGKAMVVENPRYGKWWKVIAREGSPLICGRFARSSEYLYPERFLLPIGDSSLIEGEKWEHSNPKEDMIERAVALVNGTYKSPYSLR